MEKLKQIDLIFSRDHRRGSYTAIITLVARFESGNDIAVDLIVGETDSPKDSFAILVPLVKRLVIGFNRIKFNRSSITSLTFRNKEDQIRLY